MIRTACLLFLFFFTQIWAAPLVARQNASPTTVMTVHQTTTPSGPMTETCVITLTPIKNAQGEDAVEQVKRCKLTPAGTNNGSANPATTSFSTVETVAPSATSTLSVVSTTAAGGEAGNGAISVVGLTTGTAAPTSAATGASSSGSASSSSASASSTGSAATSASSSASSAAVTGSAGGAVANGPASSIATGAVPTPTTGISVSSVVGGVSGAINTASVSAAAAEASNSTTEAFSTPGKKLSVLPIGLGVFAGISVIALIVVGLVTYERTKYRKAFRQRKLAESGAAMGYGGMAPRS